MSYKIIYSDLIVTKHFEELKIGEFFRSVSTCDLFVKVSNDAAFNFSDANYWTPSSFLIAKPVNVEITVK